MNSQQDIDVTFKLTQIQEILKDLDEVPHKWSRKMIDSIWQVIGPQIQAQQSPKE